MASIIGTQTEKNLLKAFAGESQARNRYTMYAKKKAKKKKVLNKFRHCSLKQLTMNVFMLRSSLVF